MKIQVYLYGTLPQRFPAYDPARGLEIHLHEKALVSDLLTRLGVGDSDGYIVTCQGRVMQASAPLQDGLTVQMLQSAHGG